MITILDWLPPGSAVEISADYKYLKIKKPGETVYRAHTFLEDLSDAPNGVQFSPLGYFCTTPRKGTIQDEAIGSLL